MTEINVRPHEPFALPAPALGAFPGPGGTLFRVWSTRASDASVVLYDGDVPATILSMTPVGEDIFEARVANAGPGSRYRFELSGEVVPDPYARHLPDGVHGPAAVWCPQDGHRPPAPDLDRADLVIYELHVGTFTPEGTYRAASERLPTLKELGVNCLELMPLSSFPGRWGWGYDGVAHFAPFAAYGSPEDLMALVDEAHRLGMVVLLDLVLNHFGPDGNYLAAYSPEYVTSRHHTPWGEALNYAHPQMRRLALDCADHWLRTYRFDGLRLDATHEIFDDSAVHILKELAGQVQRLGEELGTRHFLFCEDDRNAPELVVDGGMSGLWADDFHHQVRVLLTGEQDGYYAAYRPEVAELARCIERGWLYEGQDWPVGRVYPRGAAADALSASSFVYCIQNHDQIGNRAFGDRLHRSAGTEAFLAASTLLLFLPMTPILFQGQEWMASTPFHYFSDHHGELGRNITEGRLKQFAHFEAFSAAQRDAHAGEPLPDPQDEDTFRASRLNWEERTDGIHARSLALYRGLLALRTQDPVLRASAGRRPQAGVLDHGNAGPGSQGSVLWVARSSPEGSRLLLLNASGEPASLGDLHHLFGRQATVLMSSRDDLAAGLSDAGTPLPEVLPGQTALVVAVPWPDAAARLRPAEAALHDETRPSDP